MDNLTVTEVSMCFDASRQADSPWTLCKLANVHDGLT